MTVNKSITIKNALKTLVIIKSNTIAPVLRLNLVHLFKILIYLFGFFINYRFLGSSAFVSLLLTILAFLWVMGFFTLKKVANLETISTKEEAIKAVEELFND